MPQTVTITRDTFKSTVEKGGIVLVDWWAPWCGPCRAFGPVFDGVAARTPDATFAKINTQEEPELAAALEIRSIPTLMLLRDGVLLYSKPGGLREADLEDLLRRARELDMDEVRAEIARDAATRTTDSA